MAHRHRPHSGGPLVPINPAALRQALANRDWSEYQLAKAMGERPQTLAYLLHSREIVRCRRERRRALARALGVPVAQLKEQNPVHPVFEMAPGMEYLYSPKTETDARRFVRACKAAVERDFPQEAKGDLHQEILRRLLELLQVGVWRHVLLKPLTGRRPPRPVLEPAGLKRWDPVETREFAPEHEAAVRGFARAMQHALAPWFAGRARLDVDRLRALTPMPPVGRAPFATNPAPAPPELAALVGASPLVGRIDLGQLGPLRGHSQPVDADTKEDNNDR